VRFSLEFRESVRDYLRKLQLTREGRVKLYTGLIGLTAEVPESFRSDPANRPDTSSPFYHFTYHFQDDGRWWKLFVVVDDSTGAYGVLRIVYADCQ
jgi:hypothetical protein